MKELTFSLTVDEANQILEALGQQPFIKVHTLINKIQQQAAKQLQDNDKPTLQTQEDQVKFE